MTKAIELSEVKQTVLATFYLSGVRKITLQKEGFFLWRNPSFNEQHLKEKFGGYLPYVSEIFSFNELRKNTEDTSEVLVLSELIQNYCPKYHYVLKVG